MPENLLPYLNRFSPPQIRLIIFALAAYLALPPEQLKRTWEREGGFRSRQVLKGALINAVRKRLLTFTEAQEIASIIDVSIIDDRQGR